MAGELFDSYGRPVIIPVAFDDSSGLTDNYGRPLQVINALPLSGGTLTGDLNIGANKIKTTTTIFKEYAAGIAAIRNAADTTEASLRMDFGYARILQIWNGGWAQCENSDNSAIPLKARDTAVGLVEVAAVQGAADPYFRIGRDDTGVALNAVTDMLAIQSGGGGGNAAVGMGAGIAFNLSNSAHEVEKRGWMGCSLTAETNGAESSKLEIGLMKSGAAPTIIGTFYGTGGLALKGDMLLSSGVFQSTFNYCPDSVADTVGVGGYDMSAGHRALAIGTEEVAVVAAAGASDVYMPIRWNGVTYKLLLHT